MRDHLALIRNTIGMLGAIMVYLGSTGGSNFLTFYSNLVSPLKLFYQLSSAGCYYGVYPGCMGGSYFLTFRSVI